jgi:hypothetical protein
MRYEKGRLSDPIKKSDAKMDYIRRLEPLVPMLNPPQHSPNIFVNRACAQVRDRNHFASHRVFEILRDGGGVRRTQGDSLALFHTRIPA